MKSYEKVSTFPVQIFLINKQETRYSNKPKPSEPPTAPRNTAPSPSEGAPFQYLSLQSPQTNFNRIEREKCFSWCGA